MEEKKEVDPLQYFSKQDAGYDKNLEPRLERMLRIFNDELILDKLPLTTEHFDLLWHKHHHFDSLSGINLPDTIIYVKGQPLNWFFTKNSTVCKKRKEKISVQSIMEKFCARTVYKFE